MVKAPRTVIVTSCPTGTALTYMAAERLRAAGKRLGYRLWIETQGAMGTIDSLIPRIISQADAAIIASDVPVKNLERFDDKPLERVGTTTAIEGPDEVLKKRGPVTAALGGQ